MRVYNLKMNTASRDAAPKFVQRAMTWGKATNELTGLIRGLLADGILVREEADYLRKGISERDDLLRDLLVRSLAQRIERIFADGVITTQELGELKTALSDFGREDGKPVSLPLNDPMPDIVFVDRLFCFTGPFTSGTRDWCEAQVSQRNGKPSQTVTQALNYLVVGTHVSPAWANQTYGRKIEAAVELRRRGQTLAIVNEEHWLKALGRGLRLDAAKAQGYGRNKSADTLKCFASVRTCASVNCRSPRRIMPPSVR